MKAILFLALAILAQLICQYLFILFVCKTEGITFEEYLDKGKELRTNRKARFKKWFLPTKSGKIRP